MPDDPSFVERLRKGDKEACAICVREHSTHVYNLALKLTGDPAAAEDVLQETFLSAFKAIPRFEGSENPEQVLLSDEMRRAMDEAIDTLSETLKSVFVLRDVNGLSTCMSSPARSTV